MSKLIVDDSSCTRARNFGTRDKALAAADVLLWDEAEAIAANCWTPEEAQQVRDEAVGALEKLAALGFCSFGDTNLKIEE